MANGTELGVGYISIGANTAGLEKAIRQAATKSGADATKQFKKHGGQAGKGFGSAFGSQLSASMPGVGALKNTLSQYETAAGKAGALAGKALGVAFTAAATAGIAAAGYTLFKGFERYQALDAATHRLNNLNKTFTALGKTGIDVQKTMKDVGDVVTGTPYSLSAAFTEATNAIASGVTDVKRYMTDVADAAAFAGDDISNIGQAFTQVINNGKVDAGILQNQLRNLPIKAWLNEVYGGTEDMTKAIREGRVGIEQLQYVIQKFAAGTAQTAGDTIAGSIENMKTAFAKLGAEILSALFGGPTQDGVNGLKGAIDSITGKLKQLSSWVQAHRDEIKDAFNSAVSAVKTLAGAINGIKDALDKVGIGVGDLLIAFAGLKALKFATTMTSLGSMNTMLATTLPTSAKAGASKISAALAGIAVPAWLLAITGKGLNETIDQYLADNHPGAHDLNHTNTPDQLGRQARGAVNDFFGNLFPSLRADPGPLNLPTMAPLGGKRSEHESRRGGIPQPTNPSSGAVPGSGGPPPLLPGGGSSGGGGGAGSTPKPVVPYDTNLPDWARGGANDPAMFSAQTSWLDARHDLAEKEAFLNQLEQGNTATAAEIQDAKNAVIEADRAMHEQDMRLQESKRKSFEGMSATTEQYASAVSDLGSVAQLDDDLGLSRGLVGLADNLLKFLGGLAAAPIKGLLAGITKELKPFTPEAMLTGGGGGGSGMNGMFGSLTSGLGSLFSDSSATTGGLGAAASYGLKPGTNISYGGKGFPPWVYQMANAFGLEASTYGGHQESNRPDIGAAPNPQGLNRGIDWRGTPAALSRFSRFMQGSGMAEQLIYQNPNSGEQFGFPFGVDYGGDFGGHQDHAHTRHGSAPPPQVMQQLMQFLPQFGSGGGIPGKGNSDSVPVMATPGEHMLTTGDVMAMGGHDGVLSFRKALHRNVGGAIGWQFPQTPVDEQQVQDTAPATPSPTQPAPITPTDAAGPAPVAPTPAPPPFGASAQVEQPQDIPVSTPLGPQQPPGAPPLLGADGMPVKGPDGQMVGVDGKPRTPEQSAADEALSRLAGFIPKAAKANTVAGTSNLSRLWMSGAEIINGLIDQGASAATTAVAAGITAGSMGIGAAGGAQAGSAAASFAIGLGTEAAKRSVSYWYQMAGIASDAIVEQLFPFGAPSFIGFDSAQNSINGLIAQDKKARPGGVFDSGGVLEPGGVAVNMSKQPESVLTQQQWDMMSQTQPAAPSYGVNIENVAVSDVNEMSRALNQRQRLAAMQYTGRPGI